eukprot:GHVQ01020981.1.p1 GENE.GHVQ01020981.1~~GHVQ01020981.1.p1  ORF type:complete len:2588 (-),score=520.52 GHVQ01020981.1:165-7928(-)
MGCVSCKQKHVYNDRTDTAVPQQNPSSSILSGAASPLSLPSRNPAASCTTSSLAASLSNIHTHQHLSPVLSSSTCSPVLSALVPNRSALTNSGEPQCQFVSDVVAETTIPVPAGQGPAGDLSLGVSSSSATRPAAVTTPETTASALRGSNRQRLRRETAAATHKGKDNGSTTSDHVGCSSSHNRHEQIHPDPNSLNHVRASYHTKDDKGTATSCSASSVAAAVPQCQSTRSLVDVARHQYSTNYGDTLDSAIFPPLCVLERNTVGKQPTDTEVGSHSSKVLCLLSQKDLSLEGPSSAGGALPVRAHGTEGTETTSSGNEWVGTSIQERIDVAVDVRSAKRALGVPAHATVLQSLSSHLLSQASVAASGDVTTPQGSSKGFTTTDMKTSGRSESSSWTNTLPSTGVSWSLLSKGLNPPLQLCSYGSSISASSCSRWQHGIGSSVANGLGCSNQVTACANLRQRSPSPTSFKSGTVIHQTKKIETDGHSSTAQQGAIITNKRPVTRNVHVRKTLSCKRWQLQQQQQQQRQQRLQQQQQRQQQLRQKQRQGQLPAQSRRIPRDTGPTAAALPSGSLSLLSSSFQLPPRLVSPSCASDTLPNSSAVPAANSIRSPATTDSNGHAAAGTSSMRGTCTLFGGGLTNGTFHSKFIIDREMIPQLTNKNRGQRTPAMESSNFVTKRVGQDIDSLDETVLMSPMRSMHSNDKKKRHEINTKRIARYSSINAKQRTAGTSMHQSRNHTTGVALKDRNSIEQPLRYYDSSSFPGIRSSSTAKKQLTDKGTTKHTSRDRHDLTHRIDDGMSAIREKKSTSGRKKDRGKKKKKRTDVVITNKDQLIMTNQMKMTPPWQGSSQPSPSSLSQDPLTKSSPAALPSLHGSVPDNSDMRPPVPCSVFFTKWTIPQPIPDKRNLIPLSQCASHCDVSSSCPSNSSIMHTSSSQRVTEAPTVVDVSSMSVPLSGDDSQQPNTDNKRLLVESDGSPPSDTPAAAVTHQRSCRNIILGRLPVALSGAAPDGADASAGDFLCSRVCSLSPSPPSGSKETVIPHFAMMRHEYSNRGGYGNHRFRPQRPQEKQQPHQQQTQHNKQQQQQTQHNNQQQQSQQQQPQQPQQIDRHTSTPTSVLPPSLLSVLSVAMPSPLSSCQSLPILGSLRASPTHHHNHYQHQEDRTNILYDPQSCPDTQTITHSSLVGLPWFPSPGIDGRGAGTDSALAIACTAVSKTDCAEGVSNDSIRTPFQLFSQQSVNGAVASPPVVRAVLASVEQHQQSSRSNDSSKCTNTLVPVRTPVNVTAVSSPLLPVYTELVSDHHSCRGGTADGSGLFPSASVREEPVTRLAPDCAVQLTMARQATIDETTRNCIPTVAPSVSPPLSSFGPCSHDAAVDAGRQALHNSDSDGISDTICSSDTTRGAAAGTVVSADVGQCGMMPTVLSALSLDSTGHGASSVRKVLCGDGKAATAGVRGGRCGSSDSHSAVRCVDGGVASGSSTIVDGRHSDHNSGSSTDNSNSNHNSTSSPVYRLKAHNPATRDRTNNSRENQYSQPHQAYQHNHPQLSPAKSCSSIINNRNKNKLKNNILSSSVPMNDGERTASNTSSGLSSGPLHPAVRMTKTCLTSTLADCCLNSEVVRSTTTASEVPREVTIIQHNTAGHQHSKTTSVHSDSAAADAEDGAVLSFGAAAELSNINREDSMLTPNCKMTDRPHETIKKQTRTVHEEEPSRRRHLTVPSRPVCPLSSLPTYQILSQVARSYSVTGLLTQATILKGMAHNPCLQQCSSSSPQTCHTASVSSSLSPYDSTTCANPAVAVGSSGLCVEAQQQLWDTIGQMKRSTKEGSSTASNHSVDNTAASTEDTLCPDSSVSSHTVATTTTSTEDTRCARTMGSSQVSDGLVVSDNGIVTGPCIGDNCIAELPSEGLRGPGRLAAGPGIGCTSSRSSRDGYSSATSNSLASSRSSSDCSSGSSSVGSGSSDGSSSNSSVGSSTSNGSSSSSSSVESTSSDCSSSSSSIGSSSSSEGSSRSCSSDSFCSSSSFLSSSVPSLLTTRQTPIPHSMSFSKIFKKVLLLSSHSPSHPASSSSPPPEISRSHNPYPSSPKSTDTTNKIASKHINTTPSQPSCTDAAITYSAISSTWASARTSSPAIPMHTQLVITRGCSPATNQTPLVTYTPSPQYPPPATLLLSSTLPANSSSSTTAVTAVEQETDLCGSSDNLTTPSLLGPTSASTSDNLHQPQCLEPSLQSLASVSQTTTATTAQGRQHHDTISPVSRSAKHSKTGSPPRLNICSPVAHLSVCSPIGSYCSALPPRTPSEYLSPLASQRTQSCSTDTNTACTTHTCTHTTGRRSHSAAGKRRLDTRIPVSRQKTSSHPPPLSGPDGSGDSQHPHEATDTHDCVPPELHQQSAVSTEAALPTPTLSSSAQGPSHSTTGLISCSPPLSSLQQQLTITPSPTLSLFLQAEFINSSPSRSRLGRARAVACTHIRASGNSKNSNDPHRVTASVCTPDAVRTRDSVCTPDGVCTAGGVGTPDCALTASRPVRRNAGRVVKVVGGGEWTEYSSRRQLPSSATTVQRGDGRAETVVRIVKTQRSACGGYAGERKLVAGMV